MDPKYVMTDKYEWSIFSASVPHETLGIRGKVVSAGRCELEDGKIKRCYDRSHSLNLESRPEDADIINAHLRA